ncbi:hypothetical protein E2C01_092092 [Portunus trituberculatus]|uniref:Kazal-like domain-containing protein n=1 Tax=Portunus trituberculatus TaxID=210409 RepID=A0A5B7JKP0_PORTR|nr:hypothetical protein [Portunus trituberculatus]
MFRPLCASDGCSYINDGALACAQKEDPSETSTLSLCYHVRFLSLPSFPSP